MGFHPPDKTGFGQVLKNSAKRFPDKCAVICNDRRVTYAELDDASDRVAQAVLSSGLCSGDTVGLVSKNSIDFLEVVFGCAKAGVIVAMINWRFSPEELINTLELNEVKAVFYRYEREGIRDIVYPALKKRLPSVRMIGMDLQCCCSDKAVVSYKDFKESAKDITVPLFDDGDAALMHLHTSGTTGFPKFVVYTHANYIRHVAANAYALEFDENMIFQTMSQLFHSAALGIYAALYVGATVVLFDHFQPQEYLQTAEREGTTRLSSIPTVLHALLQQKNIDSFDLHRIKTIGYGSAPMQPRLIEQTIERLGECRFMQSYGMTEMGATVTILSPEDHIANHYRHLFSVGKPIPGAAVKITDENGAEVENDTTGEIAVRGYGMMREYLKNPAETKKVLRDGWYYSNDMGYLDEEGFLYVTGRKDDMMITGGENVFPAEVEKAIAKLDGVDESCVFGIPDDYWGQKIVACIVLKKDANLTPEEIREALRSHIAGYQVPKEIRLIKELPLTSLGKRDRLAMRALFEN